MRLKIIAEDGEAGMASGVSMGVSDNCSAGFPTAGVDISNPYFSNYNEYKHKKKNYSGNKKAGHKAPKKRNGNKSRRDYNDY